VDNFSSQNPRDEPFQAWFDLLTTLSKIEGRANGASGTFSVLLHDSSLGLLHVY
jgi:hypothetical protein